MGKREKLTIAVPMLATAVGVGLGIFLAHGTGGAVSADPVPKAEGLPPPNQDPGDGVQKNEKTARCKPVLMSKTSTVWCWIAVVCAPIAAAIWMISLLRSPDFVIFPWPGWTASLVVAGFSALFALIGISQGLPGGDEKERKTQNILLYISLGGALVIFCIFSIGRICGGAEVYKDYEWFFTCAAFMCIFIQYFVMCAYRLWRKHKLISAG